MHPLLYSYKNVPFLHPSLFQICILIVRICKRNKSYITFLFSQQMQWLYYNQNELKENVGLRTISFPI